jgi:hypothetical protein
MNPMNNESLAVTKYNVTDQARDQAGEFGIYLELSTMQQTLDSIKHAMASAKARTVLERSMTNARNSRSVRDASTPVAAFLQDTLAMIVNWLHAQRASFVVSCFGFSTD